MMRRSSFVPSMMRSNRALFNGANCQRRTYYPSMSSSLARSMGTLSRSDLLKCTSSAALASSLVSPVNRVQGYCTKKDAAPVGDEDLVVESEEKITPSTSSSTSANAEAAAAVDTEQVAGPADEHTFKAETRQLLDIVACSLYSDKEVFVRELISNASDALEKRRHMELSDPDKYGREEGDEELKISLSVSQTHARFVLRDTGIGMTKDELVANLGTICNSGSKHFIQKLKERGEANKTLDNIIGQFGVGFYSAFMVAKSVKVYSRSAEKGSVGYLWESDGHGAYKISEATGVQKGTKIVLEMKDTETAFCTPTVLERIIKKYSNFISFDIEMNGSKVNTVQALWMRAKDSVTEEEHTEFYKFVSSSYDSPLFRLHYATDAPVSVHALLYIPQTHTEKFGGGRMEVAVNLYCRRVLIQSKAKSVIPEWLRFLKGAVDCEDLPLNISREHTQDSALIRKLNTIITKRCLKWLDEESRRNREGFEKFIREFGYFLKEGVCTDQINKADIAKLLRFHSTHPDGSLISLDEYAERMLSNQSHIYYLCAPSRDMAMCSPYYEQYKEHNLEVIILTEQIDDFVMQHLDTYKKFKLQNIETFDATLDGHVQAKTKEQGETKDPVVELQLSEAQCTDLADFFSKRLLGRVGTVKPTSRLTNSPVVLIDHESAQLRKLYKMMGQEMPSPKYNIHFNPKHVVIRKLYSLSKSASDDDNQIAGLLAEQLFDNAVIAAGLLDDPRSIITRLNALMEKLVEKAPEPSASS